MGKSAISRPVGALVICAVGFLLLGSAVPGAPKPGRASLAAETSKLAAPRAAPLPQWALATPAAPAKPPPPPPPTPQEALADGVLMVVSIPSQRIFVFKDGQPWDSAPVSTGRSGHETPTGIFPILQKSVHHRSNLYSNAPMPFMQRLTWGGVALHAGHLPGYPASHGCIRLPWAFAEKLYAITDFNSSVALVTDAPLGSVEEALQLASGGTIAPRPVQLATPETPAPPADGRVQTIQLAATATPDNAAALWQQLRQQRPELDRLQHQVIPATVHSRQVFRLRASGPGAHSICSALRSAGIDCLKV